PGGGIHVELKFIQNSPIWYETTDRLEHDILENCQIEIHDLGVFMGFLQTARIERNWKTVDGVGKQVAKNLRILAGVRAEDVNSPDGIALGLPETHEVHLAADVLGGLLFVAF